jgi:hypothetical protein
MVTPPNDSHPAAPPPPRHSRPRVPLPKGRTNGHGQWTSRRVAPNGIIYVDTHVEDRARRPTPQNRSPPAPSTNPQPPGPDPGPSPNQPATWKGSTEHPRVKHQPNTFHQPSGGA